MKLILRGQKNPISFLIYFRALIRAFYIIIFIPYIILLECYLHCYINVLHVLDDLWDFHTKSLFLAFNIWEAKYPLFLFLLFQEFREPK